MLLDAERAACAGRGDGENSPSPKSHKVSKWTQDDVAVLRSHPDMRAVDLAALMGRTVSSVEHARERFGRWDTGSQGACICCDTRPVWRESPKARRLRLCKGCYLDEMQRRSAEELRANAVRQRVHKAMLRGDQG